MLQQLLEFYTLLESKQDMFTDAGLTPFKHFDIYRGQPLNPELYEYFPLPAIFIDYSMSGNGIRQKRTVAMALHVVTDTMPDTASISEQKDVGLKRFMYNLTLQSILENAYLGKTTPLKFITEEPLDIPVVNYHTQMYEFNAFLADMIGNPTGIIGQFETLNIFGSLYSKL